MILVAESINIMSNSIGPAMRERIAKPIQEMALAEVKAGADYLDINIGPARRNGEEMMQWIVNTVQEVTDKPLSLDTTNPVVMGAGLKVCKNRVLINSISIARADQLLPLAKEHNAELIGLLWGPDGMPRDANERCMLAVDLVYKANELGIPNENIWIDPIVSPISVEINQVKACTEFMGMVKEICPGAKSIVGLSNVSNGTPANLRPYLNRCYMIMLQKQGLYSAISDVFDAELVKIAKGEMPEIVDLVYEMMDGYQPDISKLSQKEREYAKSVKVLTGETLYSHSWLEV